MRNLCKTLSIKLYSPSNILYYDNIVNSKVSIQHICGVVSTLDLTIFWTCKVRKMDIVEFLEDNIVVFKWYIYDREDDLDNNYTILKVNGEKWLAKKMINLLWQQYISTPTSVVITNILNRLWQSYKQFPFQIQSDPLITIDTWFRNTIFDVFDEIVKRTDMEWDFVDWKFYFGKLSKDTDIVLNYDKWCQNDFSLKITEWDRGSSVFWYDSNIIPPTINQQTIINNSQWCLGMYDYDFIWQPLQAELDRLQGANYIYKIDNLTQEFEANVCDSIYININNCGRYNWKNKIKIQQKNITYENCIKKTEYVLSNYNIQLYSRYWLFLKK